jgi:hypothetical protein
MPLSPYAFDTYVAQHMSKLTECGTTPVAVDLPDFPTWLQTFVGNRIFVQHVPDQNAALAFSLLRRIRDAVTAHDEAVALLQRFVAGPRSVVTYFDCLARFEACLVASSITFETARKLSKVDHFTRGDGSANERHQWLYNVLKHCNPMTIPPGHLHPLWLENQGIRGAQVVASGVDERALSFAELRETVLDMGKLGDMLTKPQPAPAA